MTRFLDKSFSTYAPGDDSYRENWDRIFKKKEPEPAVEPEPVTQREPDVDELTCGCSQTFGCICYTRR